MKREEKLRIIEHNHNKAELRNLPNVTLLGICFTLFGLIISIKPELLENDFYLSLQLVCSIPLFMSTIFARTKAGYSFRTREYDIYGHITFIIAYAFLINSVGILVVRLVSPKIGIIFFLVNIFASLTYAIIDIGHDKTRIKKRILRDISFVLLIVMLGILPSLEFF